VFYDPADPTNCVLERSGPQGITTWGCISALAVFAAIGGAIYLAAVYGPSVVRAHFPRAEKPEMSVALIGFGVAVVYFFFAYRRYVNEAKSWPSVRGQVVASRVSEYTETKEGRTSTHYRPEVEYAYTVNGREYHGTQIKLGMTVEGGRGYAERIVAKYAPGSAVEVHYDPKNIGKAALENPSGAAWGILVIAAAVFALAAWTLGLFG
jgi:hypothetical protein